VNVVLHEFCKHMDINANYFVFYYNDEILEADQTIRQSCDSQDLMTIDVVQYRCQEHVDYLYHDETWTSIREGFNSQIMRLAPNCDFSNLFNRSHRFQLFIYQFIQQFLLRFFENYVQSNVDLTDGIKVLESGFALGEEIKALDLTQKLFSKREKSNEDEDELDIIQYYKCLYEFEADKTVKISKNVTNVLKSVILRLLATTFRDKNGDNILDYLLNCSRDVQLNAFLSSLRLPMFCGTSEADLTSNKVKNHSKQFALIQARFEQAVKLLLTDCEHDLNAIDPFDGDEDDDEELTEHLTRLKESSKWNQLFYAYQLCPHNLSDGDYDFTTAIAAGKWPESFIAAKRFVVENNLPIIRIADFKQYIAGAYMPASSSTLLLLNHLHTKFQYPSGDSISKMIDKTKEENYWPNGFMNDLYTVAVCGNKDIY
jgi:hypothetical protein